MSSHTWDPKDARESRMAEAIFFLYQQRRFFAKHRGKIVNQFNPKHGTLTFEPYPTAFDRILKEEPWDSSENST